MIHDQSESIILQNMQTGSKDKKHKSKERSYSHKKDKKKFCHQYQLSARRWTKSTLTPRQAVASFLLFRISLAGDIIVVVRSHLTSVMAL